jgi:hypothetical protein
MRRKKEMLFNRTRIGFKFRNMIPLILLFLLLVFQIHGSIGAEVSPADGKAYVKALKDSEEATQEKIFTKLLAVVPGWDAINHDRLHGSSIRWEEEQGTSRVLVATFLDRATYVQYYKSNLESHQESYTLQKSLWVTVVPELRNYFIKKSFYNRCPPSGKRVAQLLGLHPANPYDVLVEMWVDPKALFRPSPDPEITDHESEVATRIAQDEWIFPSDLNPFLRIDNSVLFKEKQWEQGDGVPFKAWFVNRAQTCYVNGPVLDENDPTTWGYPWTRLGYTYDWGNPKTPVGLSEFVIRIDPNKNKGELTVKLEAAYDRETPDWQAYFRCQPEAGSSGMFIDEDEEQSDLSPEDLN